MYAGLILFSMSDSPLLVFVGSFVLLGTGEEKDDTPSFTLGNGVRDFEERVQFIQWYRCMDSRLTNHPLYGSIPYLGIGYEKFSGLDMTPRNDISMDEFDNYDSNTDVESIISEDRKTNESG